VSPRFVDLATLYAADALACFVFDELWKKLLTIVVLGLVSLAAEYRGRAEQSATKGGEM
jgi:hypothetical protein